ncbi:MAG TPA: 3-oxoacyl-ACP reductase [Solirubrobacteraceae bacterium]|jgi:3-oxoacyl-[acyl-carrier protein] reductase|nr:3-oxoacyl-ACP reductase [Solirubrobacteraceae bacterium]
MSGWRAGGEPGPASPRVSDRYAQLIRTPLGRVIAGNVGLPQPVTLERRGEVVLSGTILLGGAPGARALGAVASTLAAVGAPVASELDPPVRDALAAAAVDASVWNGQAPTEQRFRALIFDASGIETSAALDTLPAFFTPVIRRLERCGRVIVLGTPERDCTTLAQATAQRALEGFVRSVGKEVGRGSTAQLVLVSPGAEDELASTLRFLLSGRSAYVSGQVIRVGEAVHGAGEIHWERPLAGRVALVTGAARGIGAEVARVLAQDGASVVALDVPGAGHEGGVAHSGHSQAGTPFGAQASAGPSSSVGDIGLDISGEDAPQQIAEHLPDGLDVLVHNAGVTRDRTLGRMDAERWASVLDINLRSQERIDELLLERGLLRPGGAIVTVSSIAGIAGNAGQTSYATSKAALIGRVRAGERLMSQRGVRINAVAPGFIETQMTAAMPIALREAGRRMNSLSQGGLPVDVAETIAWLAAPASAGVSGNVVRVCGQSLIGA